MSIQHSVSRGQVEAIAREIALEVLSGTKDRVSALTDLVALVQRSPIAYEVASRHLRRGPHAMIDEQKALDLAQNLISLTCAKIFPAQGESIVDLVRIAQGASFAGWVNQFMKTAALSELRNLTRSSRHTPLLRTPEVLDFHDSPTGNVADEVCDNLMLVVADAFTKRQFAQPHMAVLAASAALSQGFQLPPTTKPTTNAERQQIADAVTSDERATYRVVLSLSQGEFTSSPIASLFEDWDPAHLECLVDTNPLVAHQIALASVQASPPMPQKIQVELRREIRRLCGDDRKLNSLGRLAVNAWIAVSASALSVGKDHDSVIPKTDEQIACESGDWHKAATRFVLANPTMFRTVDDLQVWLTQTAERLTLHMDTITHITEGAWNG